ncbi:hypothetical protein Tco_1576635 [Tanacetum coccineum]
MCGSVVQRLLTIELAIGRVSGAVAHVMPMAVGCDCSGPLRSVTTRQHVNEGIGVGRWSRELLGLGSHGNHCGGMGFKFRWCPLMRGAGALLGSHAVGLFVGVEPHWLRPIAHTGREVGASRICTASVCVVAMRRGGVLDGVFGICLLVGDPGSSRMLQFGTQCPPDCPSRKVAVVAGGLGV